MATPGKDTVDGTKVSGATNNAGGSGQWNDPRPGLADDIATQNAINATRVPRGTGTGTSISQAYGKDVAGS